MSVAQKNNPEQSVYVVVGSHDGDVSIYNDTLKNVTSFKHCPEEKVKSIADSWLNALAVDSNFIYTAGFDCHIRIWKWDQVEEVKDSQKVLKV